MPLSAPKEKPRNSKADIYINDVMEISMTSWFFGE